MLNLISFIFQFPLLWYLIGFLQDIMVLIVKTGPIPTHMAFVMDGNRRFALNKKLALRDGHSAGAESLTQVLNCCYRIGVKAVTVYAFSIENFNRPKEEVDTLFDLLKSRLVYISASDQFAAQEEISIRIIGNRSMIPLDIMADLEKVEQATSGYTKRVLYICFPYTSRDDIFHSMLKIQDRVEKGEIDISNITPKTIEENNYFGPGCPPVDILVRTSGHTRLSDFMLWECHQDSVIEFPNTLWPNFRFWSVLWIIFKWSYYKTLQLEDAATMQVNKIENKRVKEKYRSAVGGIKHPPFASVTKS
ncbi:hypothetical protein B5S32_g2784 [[Candida] boidinii]|nr:hypothetical protein B5S32_g2784 [[Candida] boidinii]